MTLYSTDSTSLSNILICYVNSSKQVTLILLHNIQEIDRTGSMNYPSLLAVLSLIPLTHCIKDTQNCAGYQCLKAYLDRPEPAYKWADLGHRLEVDDVDGKGGWTGYVLNFTSQQWLNTDLGR